MQSLLGEVEILYEEGPCLAVAKPGGLLTQAPPHIDSLELRIKQYFKVREQKPGRVYLGVPHRLDRPVSGVLVLALHARAARQLSEQFEGRLVQKRYWALVEGRLDQVAGTWRDTVRKVPNEARAELVDEDHPEGRSAVLHYRVLQATDRVSWLEIELETGRTHQIRLQTSVRGLPIVGDLQYGSTVEFGPSTDDPRNRRIGLHARSLKFRHPMTREVQFLEAKLPDYWQSWPAGSGWF